VDSARAEVIEQRGWNPWEGVAQLFGSIGLTELLILLVVFGIPAGVVWAIVQAVSNRRKDAGAGDPTTEAPAAVPGNEGGTHGPEDATSLHEGYEPPEPKPDDEIGASPSKW
jgi:hypothetical protein